MAKTGSARQGTTRAMGKATRRIDPTPIGVATLQDAHTNAGRRRSDPLSST